MKKQKKLPKTLSFEEFKTEIIDTPRKKELYQKELKKLRDEIEIEKKKKKQTIGIILKKLRKDMGYSQDEFAKAVHTPKSHISRIENGKQNTTIETLVNFAAALDRELVVSFK